MSQVKSKKKKYQIRQARYGSEEAMMFSYCWASYYQLENEGKTANFYDADHESVCSFRDWVGIESVGEEE